MAKRTRATLTLNQRDDGTVVVEIRPSQPLGPFHSADGAVYEPDEYLSWASAFALGISAPQGQRWRYPEVRASAPGDPLVNRILDMSEGSQERAMVAVLVDQSQLPVIWVNEGVELLHTPFHTIPEAWRDALASTEGISAKAWQEEIDELLWSQSDSWRRGPRPKRHRRRSVTPPPGPLPPFFAPRSGAIPRTGSPQLDDATLPVGSRQPPRPAAYWATDEPVSNLQLLAPWLASRFSHTGLWPLLWRFDEEPSAYMYGHGDLDAIDQVDLSALIGDLADVQASNQGRASTGDSASTAESTPPHDPFPAWALSEPARLLLVPCNRPADAVTALGGVAGDTDPPQVSAALRGWETRYGAILFEVAPGLIRLSVARPPADHDQALALAAELQALSTENSDVHHQAPQQVAAELLAGEREHLTPDEATLARTKWDIAC